MILRRIVVLEAQLGRLDGVLEPLFLDQVPRLPASFETAAANPVGCLPFGALLEDMRR